MQDVLARCEGLAPVFAFAAGGGFFLFFSLNRVWPTQDVLARCEKLALKFVFGKDETVPPLSVTGTLLAACLRPLEQAESDCLSDLLHPLNPFP